jgi:hypothetical protein
MNFELFENINFLNIKNLFDLALNNPENLRAVKINYSRNNKHLQENLNFLIMINIFEITDNTIKINNNSGKDLKEFIISSIVDSPVYAACVKNYLSFFQKDDKGTYFFKPDNFYNIKSSDLRNFLITAGYVKNLDNKYILLDESILAKFTARTYSPEQLKQELLEKELLGAAAEKLIIKYETDRIKEFGSHLKLDHVSLRDVSAGYDIQSYEGNTQIFIEVKAVSVSNYKFHLSVSEFQTAINFKKNYYVYLLPVDYSKPDKFDIDKLLRINDLKKNIFEEKSTWSVINDGYIISKIN